MYLFKNHNLNIAIIISASCHLVFMSAITPVLVSGDIKENHTRVSFLGSILKKVAGETFSPFAGTTRDTFRRKMSLAVVGAESVPSDWAEGVPSGGAESIPYSGQSDKEKFIFSEDKYKTPVFKLHYKKKEKPKIKFKDILVEGEARNRMLLYRPDLEQGMVSLSNFSSNYELSVRFKISQDGFVVRPECIVSSGSSEVDQMALRYIRRWQFVPLDEVQEGIVRVVFTDVKK